MKHKRLPALILSALLLTGLGGCATPGGETTPPTAPQQTQQTEPATQAPLPTAPTEDPDWVRVSTPRGDLRYPEQWSGLMKTVQTTEGDLLTVAFLADFDGGEYELFQLVIGPGEEEPAATITAPDGTVHNVYVHIAEELEHDALTEDEQNCLYAMLESINDVIASIQ